MDNKGEVIHAFLTRDQQWRMKTDLTEISPLLRKTIIEKEDKYFYYHPGVNPVAMLRALGRNILSCQADVGRFEHDHDAGGAGVGAEAADLLEQAGGGLPRLSAGMDLLVKTRSFSSI